MSVFARLLRVGSIAQSMSIYLPAMALQKGLGLARMVLLTYLITAKGAMGDWQLGVMVFSLFAPVATLGSNHALGRFVGAFEAQGRLVWFFRRMRLWVVVLAVTSTGLLLLASEPILQAGAWLRGLLSASDPPAGRGGEWRLTLAIIGNIGALALYLNLASFLYALRVYRLAAVVELAFSVLFTVAALVWVAIDASALSLLLAHAGSLLVVVVAGQAVLSAAVRRIEPGQKAGPGEPVAVADFDTNAIPDPADASGPAKTSPDRLRQVIRFGAVAMLAALIWQAAEHVSYFLVYAKFGPSQAAPLGIFMRLSQPVVFLAAAAWSVLFSHVARRWEAGDRPTAMYVLETAYKAIAVCVMTLSVLLYITSPFWRDVVAAPYRYGSAYIPGLLTFFITFSNLSLLTMLAKLHRQPVVIALAALAGMALNVVLALLWMPAWSVNGAARAAGVGMFFGAGLVTLIYLLRTRTRLQDSTYFVLATPLLLLLPIRICGPAWAVVLLVAFFSPWVFTRRQKRTLAASAGGILRSWRRGS